MSHPNPSPIRVNVYVDAFNLYYGALRGTQYRWLDLAALSRALLRPDDTVHRIRYFTATVAARPDDPGKPQRQQTYLRALRTIPEVTIHLGRHLTSQVRMPLAAPTPGGPRTVEVIRSEEKGSDVNLATYLLLDAVRDDYDLAVFVSNDSDLCEPIRVVQHDLGRPVGIWNPHSRRSYALQNVGPAFFKQIRPRTLGRSQFPPVIHDERGAIRKPVGW